MTHNEFDVLEDLYEPISQFLIESNIHPSTVIGRTQGIRPKYFYTPKVIREMTGALAPIQFGSTDDIPTESTQCCDLKEEEG